jgi:hypothetical protein
VGALSGRTNTGPYPASYARAGEGPDPPVSSGLSACRPSLLGSSFSRRGLQPPLRLAYQAGGLDPVGVSTFRTSKTRLGWAPPLPRDQRCPPSGLSYPEVAWCLAAPGPVTAANTPSTRPQSHEASSRVHLRSPVQPSPRLLHPDGRDALGLERSASHPAVTSGACERGDGPWRLARSSADRYLLHVAVLTYLERLRVAH